MSASKKTSAVPKSPQIVGTVHSPGSLKRALALRPGEVDLLELRVDHFADDPDLLRNAVPRLKFPFIVTVRHPKEGGAQELATARREELYRQFMDVAQYIDVEVRSLRFLSDIIEEARNRGVAVIVSDHHFRATPSLGTLQERLAEARTVRPDIVKVAANASRATDLATLLTFLNEGSRRQPLSIMAMGAFGKISRLLFARAGSLLNYGFLDQAQVPGQWEATCLKLRFQEICQD